MAGAQFAIVFEDQTISADTALVVVRPGVTFGFKVVRAWLMQHGSGTSGQVRAQLGRKAGSGGLPSALTSFTPRPCDERLPTSKFAGGTSAAAGTCGIMTTTLGGGAFTSIYPLA